MDFILPNVTISVSERDGRVVAHASLSERAFGDGEIHIGVCSVDGEGSHSVASAIGGAVIELREVLGSRKKTVPGIGIAVEEIKELFREVAGAGFEEVQERRAKRDAGGHAPDFKDIRLF